MRDQYIFDIPVYRLTSDEFNSEIDIQIAKRIARLISYDSQRRPLSREIKERERHLAIAESGGPWQFNQIIGWLRLFTEGRTVGGHLWWANAKRLNRRMRHKRLYLLTTGDVLGAWFPDQSSKEIFEILLERLSDMATGRPSKNRYVDLESFRRVGPFIDWSGLLGRT